MNWNLISIFPDMLAGALQFGVVGQAAKKNKVGFQFLSPRQFTSDFHKTVDDRPYGGGDGMVMLYEPLKKSMQSLGEAAGHRVLLSAQGHRWGDHKARIWAGKIQSGEYKNITLVCGRYGGVDQRFINEFIDEEISIGDYILSGGELGALVLIDSVVRLLPEVLGNIESTENESFADGLLEAPLFTRPQNLEQPVPQVFLSGDHAKIKQLRRLLAILTTLEKRPDLITEAHHAELMQSANLLAELSPAELKSCGLGRIIGNVSPEAQP